MNDLRIGLIDSNELVRSGRAMIINSQVDMRVVLEESDPVLAIERSPNYLVDVLLVGPSQHRLRGEEYIQVLAKALFEANNDCAIISYNAFTSSKLRYEAIRAGAQDFYGLDGHAKELLAIIKKVVKRDFRVDSNELAELAREFGSPLFSSQLELKLSELTETQTKAVNLFIQGESDNSIAKQLDLARTRVSQLIEILLKIAGFTSRNQLFLALNRGAK